MKEFIEQLLLNAHDMNASDLHVTADSLPFYRINGVIRPYGERLVSGEEIERMVKAILTAESWEELNKKREIDFSYSIQNEARYRINVFFQRGRISLAARVIPEKIPSIEQLGLPPILKDLADRPHGLILVTGPTGSGKSTTLASMLDYMNGLYAKHIVTLEDPIEYYHKHRRSIVHQREVGSDTASFSAGLRAALRQDPDIILVGEMRDLETISTAITAAETGHLVLATLHTNSASATINRIIDVFPPHQQDQVRFQLSLVLQGIISQRLFPLSDGSGRVAATEILVNHPSIANLIRNEKVEQIKNVMQTSRSLGMHTLETSIQKLLNSGTISAENAKPYLPFAGDL